MIEREAAIEIARARAHANGWSFVEPLEVVVRRRWLSGAALRFEITTNAGKRGTKARFVVDAESGAVVAEGYVPR